MLFNTMAQNAVWTLRQAYKQNKAAIWKALEKDLSGSRNNRREVNLGQLSSVTNDGEVVVIAGKVLGSGTIDHKLTVCAFSFSETAANKIVGAGGKVMMLKDFVKAYPRGKGVKIIG